MLDLIIAFTSERETAVMEQATKLIKQNPTAMIVIVGSGGNEAKIASTSGIARDLVLIISHTRCIIDALLQVTNQLIVPLKLKHVQLVCAKPFAKVGERILNWMTCCGVDVTLDNTHGVGPEDPNHVQSSLAMKTFNSDFKHLRSLRDMVLWLNFEHHPL